MGGLRQGKGAETLTVFPLAVDGYAQHQLQQARHVVKATPALRNDGSQVGEGEVLQR